MKIRVLIAPAVAVLMGGVAMGAVYEQLPDMAQLGTGYWSSNYLTYYPYMHGENFTLDAGAGVTGVTWWGGSEYYLYPDLTNFAGWEVTFYEDAAGLPGGVIYNEYFAKAATNPVDTGYDGWQGANVYSHEVGLASPVNLGGGTQYWLSIAADLISAGDDGWWWQISEPVDNLGATWDWNSQYWSNSYEYDVTFSLIPAPGALALLGLAGLVSRRRR
jgi:hypothetical protein